MEYHVLGPLLVSSTPAAHHEPEAVGQLTAPKPRQVLALLLLHGNLVVPVETLIAELWGVEPPASAQTTLQTYILKIRRMLTASNPPRPASEILVTASGGYRFTVGPGELDLHEYERLAGEGREALGRGDDVTGSGLLGRALGLWHGGALVDVRHGTVLEAEVQRLEEGRLSLWRQRIAAELRLDRHQTVLGELGWLAARHPLNEDLQAQYMVALYRAGRRTDALEAFHRLRGTLQNDLGLEPSQRIQRLQHAILTDDPTLDSNAAGTDPLTDARLVPVR
jgi:DNA-binding SARP family transcriptional activator